MDGRIDGAGFRITASRYGNRMGMCSCGLDIPRNDGTTCIVDKGVPSIPYNMNSRIPRSRTTAIYGSKRMRMAPHRL